MNIIFFFVRLMIDIQLKNQLLYNWEKFVFYQQFRIELTNFVSEIDPRKYYKGFSPKEKKMIL